MSAESSQAHDFAAKPGATTEPEKKPLTLGEEQPDGSVVVSGFEDDTAASTQEAAPAQREVQHSADDDDDDSQTSGDSRVVTDTEMADAATDAEREAIRERRRRERAEKRDRRRERDESMRRELEARDRIIDDMKRQLDALNRRSIGGEISQIDARLAQNQQQVTYLKSVIQDAVKVGNGEAVAEATERMAKTMREAEELTRVRQAVVNNARTPQAAEVDPRMVANAQAWFGAHRWYDPRGQDPDSRMVLALDAQVSQEGYDPNTKEYWDELSDRVERSLPHRFKGTAQNNSPRASGTGYNGAREKPGRSVVTGTGNRDGAAAGGAGKSGFVLSPERVRALKDAGMWDNPKARSEAIERFRNYDAAQSASGSR